MGQNFLFDANIIRIITDAVEPSKKDAILEVGGGLGVLTEMLVENAGWLTCVEKDHKLFKILTDRLGTYPNIELKRADMLELTEDCFLNNPPNKFASNLPYSVGNRILVDIFNWEQPPDTIVVTVQQDVAERIVAQEGTKDFGILSIAAQVEYDVHLIKNISPTSFYPAPRVKSSVLKMTRHNGRNRHRNKPLLMKLLRLAFARRRKQIASLAAEFSDEPYINENLNNVFSELGIDLSTRPEQISAVQWREIVHLLSKPS